MKKLKTLESVKLFSKESKTLNQSNIIGGEGRGTSTNYTTFTNANGSFPKPPIDNAGDLDLSL